MKIELPTQLHDKHHLLFSFYHVTCDINAKTNAKRKESLETPGESVGKPAAAWCQKEFLCKGSFLCGLLIFVVGFSWLPLFKEGRLSSQEFSIPVSCNLPPGYLAIKEASNTKVRGGGHVKGHVIFALSVWNNYDFLTLNRMEQM